MRKNIVNAGFACLLMISTALLAVYLKPRHFLSEKWGLIDLDYAIPAQFSNWRLDDFSVMPVVNPQQQAMMEKIYTKTLSRIYVNDKGERVMLVIAYGADQRDGMQLHYPEVCYPAQGFLVNSNIADTLFLGSKKMQVRHLETVLDNRRFEPVTYWFTVGNTVLADSKMKKWVELDYTLRQRVIPDGLLVRVSSINQDSHAAYVLHRNFLAQLMPAVMPRYRERLFGSALSS